MGKRMTELFFFHIFTRMFFNEDEFRKNFIITYRGLLHNYRHLQGSKHFGAIDSED